MLNAPKPSLINKNLVAILLSALIRKAFIERQLDAISIQSYTNWTVWKAEKLRYALRWLNSEAENTPASYCTNTALIAGTAMFFDSRLPLIKQPELPKIMPIDFSWLNKLGSIFTSQENTTREVSTTVSFGMTPRLL